jgi:hypothetical protein
MNSQQDRCEAGADQQRGAGEGAPGMHASRAPASHAKTTQHQVREIHRLVDNAMEDLEQVARALRFLERDV